MHRKLNENDTLMANVTTLDEEPGIYVRDIFRGGTGESHLDVFVGIVWRQQVIRQRWNLKRDQRALTPQMLCINVIKKYLASDLVNDL